MPAKKPTYSIPYKVTTPSETIAKKKSARAAVVEQLGVVLGDSGTQRYAGYFQEEYNPDWREETRVDNVEEMRRGDAACKAAIKAIKAPLLAAKWSVKTTGTDTHAEEIRKCAEDALFKMEKRTFDAFLREALEYLSFGHYAFELIWDIRDGKVTIKDLAPRIPRSIQSWKLKDGRRGIRQLIRTDEYKAPDGKPATYAEIPIDKLLVLTNDMEGDDITGQSILRPAWKHYSLKQTLYKVEAISAERFGSGIPTIWLPDGAGDSEKEEAEDIAGNVRTNQKAFIVMPGPKASGWEFEIVTPSGNPQAGQIEGAIKHHNKMILVAVLANFLGLDGGEGSYARSTDLSSFFLHTVGDMARYVAQEIGRQVIRRVVDANYGPQSIYPTLEHSALGDIDTQAMAATVASLVQAGMMDPSIRNKQWATETFNLPEIPQDEIEAQHEAELEAQLAKLEQGDDDGMNMPEDEDEAKVEEPEDETEE